MNNTIKFPNRFGVDKLRYLYKLYYIEENDTLWTSMQDPKTKEWGSWYMISEGFLSGRLE